MNEKRAVVKMCYIYIFTTALFFMIIYKIENKKQDRPIN
jgi:hypothetical protein